MSIVRRLLGKKPSSGSWLRSSARYRPSQVRKARSSAATSAACKTPKCRRIKSFETVATARLRKEGCSKPAARQNARPVSPGRNVPRSKLTATTIRSSDADGGWATTAGLTLAADWSENEKGQQHHRATTIVCRRRHRGRYPRPWRRPAPKGARTTGSSHRRRTSPLLWRQSP